MFEILQITKQDDWEYFPVYTGSLSMNSAFEYVEKIRNSLKDKGTGEKIIKKLRWIPSAAKKFPEYKDLNYLPYIIVLDVIIEVRVKDISLKELEKIRDWFKEYIILTEGTNDR